MAQARYNANLPSVHLQKGELEELEKLLLGDEPNSEFTIILDSDQLSYEFSTVDEMSRDPSLPAFFVSFEIQVEAADGEVRVASDPDETTIELTVNGEQEWVKRQVRQIEDFFGSRGDTIRTQLQNHLVKGVLAIVVGGGLVAHYSGFGNVVGIARPGDVLGYGFLALIGAVVVLWILDYVYPYSLIKTRSGEEYRPYISLLVKLLTILAAILTIGLFVSRLGILQ